MKIKIILLSLFLGLSLSGCTSLLSGLSSLKNDSSKALVETGDVGYNDKDYGLNQEETSINTDEGSVTINNTTSDDTFWAMWNSITGLLIGLSLVLGFFLGFKMKR